MVFLLWLQANKRMLAEFIPRIWGTSELNEEKNVCSLFCDELLYVGNCRPLSFDELDGLRTAMNRGPAVPKGHGRRGEAEFSGGVQFQLQASSLQEAFA